MIKLKDLLMESRIVTPSEFMREIKRYRKRQLVRNLKYHQVHKNFV